jgi:hypothetical protein
MAVGSSNVRSGNADLLTDSLDICRRAGASSALDPVAGALVAAEAKETR